MTGTTKDNRQHLAEFVSKAQAAMLTTTTPDGRRVSRPMALQDVEFDGDLWFFAYDDSAKVAQIATEPQVNVSFSDTKHHSWASISGRAEVVHDRAKAEELYSPALKAWFPDGLDTPGIVLIRVNGESAEYWDAPTSTVGFALGALRAAVTNDPHNDPIDNNTVRL